MSELRGKMASGNWEALLPEIFEFVHLKLQEMSMDVMNWQLAMIAPWLSVHGVQYERDNFRKLCDAEMLSTEVRCPHVCC